MKKISFEKMSLIEGGIIEVSSADCFVHGLFKGMGILVTSGLSLLAPDPIWKYCMAN